VTRRAPYLTQLEPFIGTSLFWTSRSELLEVHQLVNIEVRWVEKKAGKLRPRTQVWEARPGQVLFPNYRNANQAELYLIKTHPEMSAKAFGAVRIAGRMKVRIVTVYQDLPSAVRSVLRHIPRRLIGERKPGTSEVIIPGEYQEIGELVRILSHLTHQYALKTKLSLAESREILEQLEEVRQALSQAKVQEKIKAAKILVGAARGDRQEIMVKIGQATLMLSRRQYNDLQITEAVLERAGIWLRTMRKIERGINLARDRISSMILSREISGGEMEGIFAYLKKVGPFDPYCSVILTPEVARLTKGPEYLAQGEKKRAIRTLIEAAAKLEKLILGSIPTPSELRRARTRLT